MARAARVLGLVAVLVGLCGCAGHSGEDASAQGAPAPAAIPSSVSAMVLGSSQLEREGGLSVLDAIQANLPAVRVAQTAGCPTLSLRGPNPLPGVVEPTIYVDGAHVSDTCILQDLAAQEMARVEVYPAGYTNRPGYDANPSGLILLFSRHASDDLSRR